VHHRQEDADSLQSCSQALTVLEDLMDCNVHETSYQNDRSNRSRTSFNCDISDVSKEGDSSIDNEGNFVSLSERKEDLFKSNVEDGSNLTKKQESLMNIYNSTPHQRINNNGSRNNYSSTSLSTPVSVSATLSYAVNTGITSGIFCNDNYDDDDDDIYVISIRLGYDKNYSLFGFTYTIGLRMA
jgi:hypothetical protein